MNFLNTLLVFIVSFSSHYSRGDPYVPNPFKNEFEFVTSGNKDHSDANIYRTFGLKTSHVKGGRTKTSGVKTSSFGGGHGGGFNEAMAYKAMPPTPMFSTLKCSQYSGCRATCESDYQFPNGQTQLFITCNNARWTVEETDWIDVMPSCEPICSPPCLNNGICLEPDVCDCPENYSGTRCELETIPCLNYPAIPRNSRRTCNPTSCTVTCLAGHKFHDGSDITNILCKQGSWVPSKPQWVTVPDCEPVCDPPCENGGICMSFNVCQCPKEFRGPQCQYSASVCKAQKLNFNGGYNCSGNGDIFQCSLMCPEGIEFEFPPANAYVCSYAEGKFLPEPIPQCVFEDNMNVITMKSKEHSYRISGIKTGIKTFRHGVNTNNGYEYGSEGELIVKRVSSVKNFSPVKTGEKQIQKVVVYKTPEPESCFAWNGAHYKTFDGKIFSFKSACEHVLVRDAIDETFIITAQNSLQCQSSYDGCYKIVTIYLRDKVYVLKQSDNGKPIFTKDSKILALPGRAPGIRAQMSGRFTIVTVDVVGIKIKWDGESLVQIEAQESLWNRTAGLCGLMDGDPENDMLLKDGTKPRTAVTLATNWQIRTLGDVCNVPIEAEHACQNIQQEGNIKYQADQFCEKLLKNKRFESCHNIMNPQLLMDTCRWDFCFCKNLIGHACTCQTLNVYVRECQFKGVKDLIDWRNADTCPITCTGGRVYKTCAPAGGQPTCGDITEVEEETLTCEEGCYCPEGTVLYESECIPKTMCPCTYRGKQLRPGYQVPKGCNTCTCVEGKWICTQISCGARCSALGDPHYITFDGKRYDFMGQCTYYLVKHANFTVSAENVACSGTISEAMNLPASTIAELPSCTRAVKIEYDGQTIKLKQNHEIDVNHQDVTKLPYKIGAITIRAVSSLFLIVELPNSVTIWWDGLTRAYIDVPASLVGQTTGLCGTFNSNQNDDFKTPEGDIEQSVIPFANKWKTSEKCSDIPDKIKSHPCTINIQNKAAAEQHCKIIKSQMFSGCHLYVDPEAFYQDCLYDLCSCDGEISKCLCPMISAYASECAENGVKIDWRNDVKECEIRCSGGQKYQQCGNTCTRTCFHVATQEDCKRQCVEGCNCPEGEALDENGECIPIGQCDCQYDGLSFRTGYKEVRPGLKTQELCTCANARWNCKPATPEDVQNYPAASDIKSLCLSSKNEEFTTCEPVDQPTCKNMHGLQPVSVAECRPGCKCKDGYVLDSIGKTCVKPVDCPCHHGGRSYIEGATIKYNCNNCTCILGQWKCTDIPCAAECSAWGDSHYKTFDGKMYDYQGQCDYVLAKGLIPNKHAFDISIQNVPCSTLVGVSCSKSITIVVGIAPHQETITLTREAPLSDISKLKRVFVREVGNYIIVEEPDTELIVHWDKGTRVYVKLGTIWKNKVNGLCGNYNDNQMDDFQTPSGGINEISPQLFGDSWRLQSYCPKAVEIENTCEQRPDRQVWALKKCGVLKSSAFALCHSEVPVESYLEKCIFDTCACDQGGDCECLCTALAAYAHECNNRGVAVKWRSKTLCPMQCNEECSHYDPCISPCPIETCDNSLIHKEASASCKYDVCLEGCKIKPCPSDFIYTNSSYSECIPRKECKPICLEIDDKVYYEGDLVENDDCYSCYCSRGKKQCQGQPCTTTPVCQTRMFNVQCKQGWTQWINQDKDRGKSVKGGTKGGKSTTKLNDKEPLPGPLIMNTLIGAHCEIKQITDIECRTVTDHISPKETGLNVECSIEKGLICTAENEHEPCPDFEIRVKCGCGVCDPYDVVNVNFEHPTDCQLFYECMQGLEGPELVTKSCGPGTWYNPSTKVCDFPFAVMSVRPQCGTIATTTHSVAVEPEVGECPFDEVFVECAVPCTNLCVYYSHTLRLQGRCQNGITCEEGCKSQYKSTNCPPGQFWSNNQTCVAKHDCMCVSYEGKPVKPGDIIQESPCEVCQCIDNFYVCDNTICQTPSPIIEPTTTIRTPSNLVFYPTTVSPPLECSEDRFINLINNPDNPLSDDMFSASSIMNKPFSAKHARIITKPTKTELGRSWSPNIDNKDQYLQIDLGRQEPVYGIIVQGNPVYNEFVTSYHVLYSPDGHTFNYVSDLRKHPQTFRGPVDGHSPVKQMFDFPVEAKVIRINPLTWQGRISMKVELIGCGEVTLTTTYTPPILCSDPLGITNGLMADQQITVSSETPPAHTKKMIRFDNQAGWQPYTSSPSEWIQIDFLEPRNLTGLVTNGGSDGWISAYYIKYSHNGIDWNTIVNDDKQDKLFLGNFDKESSHTNTFGMAIQARYLKLIPVKWQNVIQLRLEVIGCFIPYPIIPTTTEPPQMSCESCPGTPVPELELEACHCLKNKLWNGVSCVSRAECPCLVGDIPYAVGAVFEKEDCSKCVCKLGGIEHCTPNFCNPCEKGLRSVVNSKCQCTCRPCPDGTILCPTSNICIKKEDWCNGVKDCPDDEVGCVEETINAVIKKPVYSTKRIKLPVTPKACEIPSCPDGYEIIIDDKTKAEKLQYTMFSSSNSYVKGTRAGVKNPSKGGVKSGTKGGVKQSMRPQLTEPIIKEETDECPTFACVANYELSSEMLALSQAKCPPAVCPNGYAPEFENRKNVKSNYCPKYFCKLKPPADAVCEVNGRTFTTFDNTEYKYDICNHIIARDFNNFDWDIILMKACDKICSRNLIINHDEHVFTLYPDFSIEFDGYKYTLEQSKKIGEQYQFFNIMRLGDTLVFISNEFNFWVIWDLEANVKIGVARRLMGTVDGLCGFFNDYDKDDKRMPEGSVAKTTEEFGDSWAEDGGSAICEIKACSEELQTKSWQICSLAKEEIFSPCASLIHVDSFISKCMEKTCQCLEEDVESKEVESKCKCRALQNLVVECLAASVSEEVIDWRMKYDCPAVCEAPLIHHDCYRRRCEPTCGALADPNACPKLENVCFPGCYCPPGYVRNGDKCVSPTDCGDCECSLLPALEYVTYDQRNFTINGKCSYVMSRDILSPNGQNRDFEVIITNGPCEAKKTSANKMCIGKVTILYKDWKLVIRRDQVHNKLKTVLNNEALTDYSTIKDWAQLKLTPLKHAKINLHLIGVQLSVFYPSLGVTLKVPSYKYSGNLEGICGDCDGDASNDMQTPKHEVINDINDFANAWLSEQVSGVKTNGVKGRQNCGNLPKEECVNAPKPDPCKQLEDREAFGRCHAVLDPTVYIEWCRKETCNGETENACEAIEAYARECSYLGVCINWHSKTCPAIECPNDMVFKTCAEECQQTCDSIKDKESSECNEPPSEGCFCPEGKVLSNDQCIIPEKCQPCDDQNHWYGDVWTKDVCTNCTCDGHNVICEVKTCPDIITICEKGFMVMSVNDPEQCCDKYICVPKPTEPTTCAPPQPIDCGFGQNMNMITNSDGCNQFICECKPIDECEKIPPTPEPMEPGKVREVDHSGCCPVLHEKCKKELCPEPPACPEFFIVETNVVPEKCCPEYKCEPPKDKCIVSIEYENDVHGGERKRILEETKKYLKQVGDTWEDGPCRKCTCVIGSSEKVEHVCTVIECPSILDSNDYNEYILKTEPVFGQCCPNIKRDACKFNGVEHKVGEKWNHGDDYCTLYECSLKDEDVHKITTLKSCDTKCEWGWEYVPSPPDLKKCCGYCKPFACVVEDKLYKIGEKWSSSDYCTNYECKEMEGTLQVQSSIVTCQNISKDLEENFVIKTTPVPGECCADHKIVACKVGEVEYKIGDTWPSPHGDKCKNYTCIETENGELKKQEHIQYCKTDCPIGWEYKESQSSCCGECEQVACVVDGALRQPAENWTSTDGCITYFCDKVKDQFMIASMQESCPDIEGCPVEDITVKGCCEVCSYSRSQANCIVQEMPVAKTKELIAVEHAPHGMCSNRRIINGLTECVGTCSSHTMYNKIIGEHENECTCCQATQYTSIIVDLVCEDGFIYKKLMRVPSHCGCHGCASEENSKTKTKSVKTG
ncbi:hypothetical protein FQR65_LT13076 [Abscondita terminalis]|nr:hypothetical protein FQR65_LT13076 [Abscondita terminalis]